ncbi:MAG: hypothetical protein MK188_05290 [Gammaproteobacteria bacterium]|nr:hypothetical protein [Gammaproteobacteria bacterium]
MLSGSKALSNIDQTLYIVRSEAVRLDKQLSQLTGQATLGQRRRLELLQQIAEVRLSEIERGELKSAFDDVDTAVTDILKHRTSAIDSLEKLIDSLNAQIEHSEQDREQLLLSSNEVSKQFAQLEAEVQEQLKQTQDYIEQYQAAQKAESVATEAERKVEQSIADFAEKAKPYQDDALFMYLYERGFGTTEYSGGLFARHMDSWVARLIKYEPARINFWNLNEIPTRLTDHADRVAELADQEFTILQQMEKDALEAAGSTEMETKLNDLRAKVDSHDDELESKEEELSNALSERALFNAGDDDFMHQCITKVTDVLKHKNLDGIYRYVQQTHSPVDDEIVLELQNLEDSLQTLKEDMGSVRKLHDGQIGKLREIEKVRQQFKNSRYDDLRSGFDNEELIAGVLSQFVQGLVSGPDLWGTIKRNQRYRDFGAKPDFGSGGLGDLVDVLGDGGIDIGGVSRPRNSRRRKRRSSSWHIPKPRRGGGGFQFPRSTGRSGGGGFKTGGGF